MADSSNAIELPPQPPTGKASTSSNKPKDKPAKNIGRDASSKKVHQTNKAVKKLRKRQHAAAAAGYDGGSKQRKKEEPVVDEEDVPVQRQMFPMEIDALGKQVNHYGGLGGGQKLYMVKFVPTPSKAHLIDQPERFVTRNEARLMLDVPMRGCGLKAAPRDSETYKSLSHACLTFRSTTQVGALAHMKQQHSDTVLHVCVHCGQGHTSDAARYDHAEAKHKGEAKNVSLLHCPFDGCNEVFRSPGGNTDPVLKHLFHEHGHAASLTCKVRIHQLIDRLRSSEYKQEVIALTGWMTWRKEAKEEVRRLQKVAESGDKGDKDQATTASADGASCTGSLAAGSLSSSTADKSAAGCDIQRAEEKDEEGFFGSVVKVDDSPTVYTSKYIPQSWYDLYEISPFCLGTHLNADGVKEYWLSWIPKDLLPSFIDKIAAYEQHNDKRLMIVPCPYGQKESPALQGKRPKVMCSTHRAPTRAALILGHMQVFHREKMYCCVICYKPFASDSARKNHTKAVHKDYEAFSVLLKCPFMKCKFTCVTKGAMLIFEHLCKRHPRTQEVNEYLTLIWQRYPNSDRENLDRMRKVAGEEWKPTRQRQTAGARAAAIDEAGPSEDVPDATAEDCHERPASRDDNQEGIASVAQNGWEIVDDDVISQPKQHPVEETDTYSDEN